MKTSDAVVRPSKSASRAPSRESIQAKVAEITELVRGLDAEANTNSIAKTQQVRAAVFEAVREFGLVSPNFSPKSLDDLFRQELSIAHTHFRNRNAVASEGVTPHAASQAVLALLRAVEAAKLPAPELKKYLDNSGADGFVVRNVVAQNAVDRLMQLKLDSSRPPVSSASVRSDEFRQPASHAPVALEAAQTVVVSNIQNNIYNITDNSITHIDQSDQSDHHVNVSGSEIGNINTGTAGDQKIKNSQVGDSSTSSNKSVEDDPWAKIAVTVSR